MMRKRKMFNMLKNDQKKYVKLLKKKNIFFFIKFLFKKKGYNIFFFLDGNWNGIVI